MTKPDPYDVGCLLVEARRCFESPSVEMKLVFKVQLESVRRPKDLEEVIGEVAKAVLGVFADPGLGVKIRIFGPPGANAEKTILSDGLFEAMSEARPDSVSRTIVGLGTSKQVRGPEAAPYGIVMQSLS